MSKRYPTVAQQEKALDEMKRILSRDIAVMTSDESVDNATPELLERVVLFEGILNMFNILEEKVTAGVMLAGKIKGEFNSASWYPPGIVELKRQAEICLELMIGKEG